MRLGIRSVLAGLFLLLGCALPSAAADKISLGLDWKAQAEYGGYYQAVAAGLYAKHGLDVVIREGGPQVNQTQMLLAGRLDFTLTSNATLAFNLVREQLPFVTVAAFFQRDPSVLIAHPGQGHDSFKALKGEPIMIGADTREGWWPFLRARFGYTDRQIRPYTFNLAPFLADKRAIQQGYLGSEPFSIRRAAGFDPVVLLLADAGFDGYGSLLTTSRTLVNVRPELVQRFVDASVEGWYGYLYGDHAAADALIRQANPEMTDELLEYGRTVLRRHGIVDSGDAERLGIGAMTDARWERFFRSVVEQGLYPASLDWRQAYTVRFVNRGVGLDQRPKRAPP